MVRADDLATKSETARAFSRQGSARVLLVLASVAVVLRGVTGGPTFTDVIVGLVVLGLLGPFEWLVHRLLLHAPSESIRMRRLGTGRGHVEHHRDPPELQWLLLCWRDVVVFSAALAAIAASWTVPLALTLSTPPLTAFATGWLMAVLALLHYEWVHLLVHTRYRPRTRYYRALAQHHRLHHYRNERYWLGVTTRTGDRLFRTMPERGAVELSPTSRTLGIDEALLDSK